MSVVRLRHTLVDGDDEASGVGAGDGPVGSGSVRRRSRPRDAGLSLVSGPAVGRGLGKYLRLGLEPMPRLAAGCRPRWCDGQRTVGACAGLGSAATIAAAVGSGRAGDVEHDRQELGVLEQQHLDAALNRESLRNSQFADFDRAMPNRGRVPSWWGGIGPVEPSGWQCLFLS